jgi:hypothetical protein
MIKSPQNYKNSFVIAQKNGSFIVKSVQNARNGCEEKQN